MVSKVEFRQAATQAIQNIVKHGDTDIFPFPFENHAFFDKRAEIVDLVIEYDENFEEYLTRFSPLNVNSLTPVTYSGFRWATQIDPIWNAHFLTCVLALSKKMEEARVAKDGTIILPDSVECTDEEIEESAGTELLATSWRRWERVEQRRRYALMRAWSRTQTWSRWETRSRKRESALRTLF